MYLVEINISCLLTSVVTTECNFVGDICITDLHKKPEYLPIDLQHFRSLGVFVSL